MLNGSRIGDFGEAVAGRPVALPPPLGEARHPELPGPPRAGVGAELRYCQAGYLTMLCGVNLCGSPSSMPSTSCRPTTDAGEAGTCDRVGNADAYAWLTRPALR